MNQSLRIIFYIPGWLYPLGQPPKILSRRANFFKDISGMQTSVRSDFFGKFHFSTVCYKKQIAGFWAIEAVSSEKGPVFDSLLHQGLIEGSDFGWGNHPQSLESEANNLGVFPQDHKKPFTLPKFNSKSIWKVSQNPIGKAWTFLSHHDFQRFSLLNFAGLYLCDSSYSEKRIDLSSSNLVRHGVMIPIDSNAWRVQRPPLGYVDSLILSPPWTGYVQDHRMVPWRLVNEHFGVFGNDEEALQHCFFLFVWCGMKPLLYYRLVDRLIWMNFRF